MTLLIRWATAWISCVLNDLRQNHSNRHRRFKPPQLEALWDSSDFCSDVLKRATSQLSMMLRSQQVTANVEEIPDESMHG